MKLRHGKLIACLALAGVMGWSAIANAALISGWDFDPLTGGSGNYGPSPFAPTSSDPNVIAGGLTRGSGVGLVGTGAANAWGGTSFNVADQAAAIAGGKFATFTIQASPGYTVSLSEIAAYNVRRSGTGPTTGIWQYRIDAGSFVDIGSSITWGATTSSAGNPQTAIDLSGIAALQNVADSSVITLRVVSWAASGTGSWYLNDPSGSVGIDFAVNGSTALIPEPASASLLAMAMLGLVALKRRRR